MKFDELVSLTGGLPWFDLPMLAQLTGEEKRSITGQLHRWIKGGKVIPLRRSMYTLAERYRRKTLSPAALANALYTPSYLSSLWALGFYGLIPEKVVTYTSVSTRVTRQFSNKVGSFHYFNVKREFFFGCESRTIDGQSITMANPEKALFDHWHLNSGEWNYDRMEGMRYQQFDLLDTKRLRSHAERFKSPRLNRALSNFLQLGSEENEGIEI